MQTFGWKLVLGLRFGPFQSVSYSNSLEGRERNSDFLQSLFLQLDLDWKQSQSDVNRFWGWSLISRAGCHPVT